MGFAAVPEGVSSNRYKSNHPETPWPSIIVMGADGNSGCCANVLACLKTWCWGLSVLSCTNPIEKEKPRHAMHEAGPIITSDLCPVRTGLMYEALPRSLSFRFWLDAVWSDQIALPNRAFALRLRLECC